MNGCENEMGFIIFLLVLAALYLLEVYVLTDTKYFWVGGILPLLIDILTIFLMVASKSYSFHDFAMVFLVFFGTLCIWGYGDDRHKKKNGIKNDK